MTTNTNPSRKPLARFAASDASVGNGRFLLVDRQAEGNTTLALIKGRQAARDYAKALNLINPAPRVADKPMNLRDTKKAAKAAAKAATTKAPAEPKADTTTTRTSHADCAHVSTKLARAICRKERAKATAN